MEKIYVVQPRPVGSKNGKSLIVHIPSKLAKAYKITSSTIFLLQPDKDTKSLTLKVLDNIVQRKCQVAKSDSFQASNQTPAVQ